MANQMNKRYGLSTAISLVIGTVIGSGIFIKGGKVLGLTAGNLSEAILVVAIVGLICIICSLVFAIVGSKYEHANGLVDYAEAALGPKFGYAVGWFMTTVYTPSLAAIVAFFASMMFCSLFGIKALDFETGAVSAEAVGVGAFILIAGYVINSLSPLLAGKLQVGMTVAKLIPLLLMGTVGTIAGLMNGTIDNVMNFVNTAAYQPIEGGFMQAIVGFAFAYEGWIMVTSIADELENPQRNLPIALIAGSLVTTAIYALYLFAMGSVGDVQTIMGTWPLGETLPRIAFSKTFGTVAGTIVYVFITISCLGTMNGTIMSSCRGLYAIAERGHGPNPKFFSDLDPQNNFSIKSALVGMIIAGFWYAWQSTLWMQGPDFFGGLHNIELIGWEPDEVSVVSLYAAYIPIMLSLFKADELSPFKRYVLPTIGAICCAFVCYACWIGKGPIMMGGYLLFLAIDLAIGFAFYGKDQREEVAQA